MGVQQFAASLCLFLALLLLLFLLLSPVAKEVDPAMFTTANFFHGNMFYIVRRDKLAWLLLVQR